MNIHFCPLCPASFDRFHRLLVHYATHTLNNPDAVPEDDNGMDIEEALVQNAIEEMGGNMENVETDPVAESWSEQQNILLRLMALHRLGRVSRSGITEMLEVHKLLSAVDMDISMSKILIFERNFRSNVYCLAPKHHMVESSSLGTQRTFKIGFITIEQHIARVYRIRESSRKLQLWKDNLSTSNYCYDLHDLPRFKNNALMQEDKRNLLLIFYVDKVNRNRQVNLGWKDVWVLRCIPAQLSKQERANMENWWDLTFVPGFLLKEKGVNFFLEPFVQELLRLRTVGMMVTDAVTNQQFRCKADYFGIIGDLPAVANVVYFKEGGYSKLLRWCMHCFSAQGEVLESPPRVNTKQTCCFVELLKTSNSTDYAYNAKYNGVNGLTALWKLDSFDTHSIFNDFFHTVLEGELKKITSELFRTDTEQVRYSLFDQTDRKMINMIVGSLPLRQDDEKMLDFVRRHPYYSGHQMFLWLRVAIPVLSPYLPKHRCDCRQGIRTSVAPDLLEYFDLQREHQYWDHFVGIREFCKFYIRMTSHKGYLLNGPDIVADKTLVRNVTRLHIHLYGDSFVSIKTHVQACHALDLMHNQGFPGWLHCFTPERDNRNIKTLNINSKDVFYHLLRISEIEKSVKLCRSSSNDSQMQAKGNGRYSNLDGGTLALLTNEYARWGFPLPEPMEVFAISYPSIEMEHFKLNQDSFFQYVRPDNHFGVGRFQAVWYYGTKYWIVAREYQVDDGELDEDVGLIKLFLLPTMIFIPPDQITAQVIVLPKYLEFFVRHKHTFTTCTDTQPHYWLCTEF